MAKLFDIEVAAREAGVSSEELAQLESSIRQGYGPDEMMVELRLLRTLRAVQHGLVSVRQAIAEFEASNEMPRIVGWLEGEALSDAERREIRDCLLTDISKAERLVLYLYYYERMTMAQIADALGTPEERVSEMHAQLLERLRSHLGDPLVSRAFRRAS